LLRREENVFARTYCTGTALFLGMKKYLALLPVLIVVDSTLNQDCGFGCSLL
jgi:hypothetical protein